MKNKKIYILLIFFLVLFIYSSYYAIHDLWRYKTEKEANDLIKEIVNTERNKIEDNKNNEEIESIYTESGILKKYDKVYQKNKDMIGWLYIEGTNIDYPVMFTKKNPQFYLRKGFNKKYAFSGSLFLGEGWSLENNYSIIYGHNMQDGTMFGDLNKYNKKSYAKKHSIIHFDTLYEENEYEVMGAFYSKLYSEDEKNVFRYYQYKNLENKKIFDEFIKLVKKSSLYDMNVKANYKDKVLVLSTCSFHTNNGRFVVVAIKKT